MKKNKSASTYLLETLKKNYHFFILLLIPFAFAMNPCTQITSVKKTKENHIQTTKNLNNLRIQVGKNTLFVRGSYLYLNPNQDGMSLGVDSTTGEIRDIDIGYQSFYKIGVGLNFKTSAWGMFFDYTNLNFKGSESFYSSDLFSFWGTSLVTQSQVRDISDKWKVKWNIYDLCIDRPFFIGQKALFYPYFGLRAGFIDQKFYQRCFVFSTVLFNDKFFSDSWFIGPRIGLEPKWILSNNFYFFAKGTFSLIYQHFKLFEEETRADSSAINSLKDKKQLVNQFWETALGLGWETYFSNHNAHININLSWEWAVFGNQNQLKYFNESTNNFSNGKPTDLTYQGLIVSARLDF